MMYPVAAFTMQAAGESPLLSQEIKIVLMIVFAVTVVVTALTGVLSRYRKIPPDKALARQLAFESSRTESGEPRFPDGFSAIVTYDQLLGVDEAIVNGKRVKRRGTERTAAPAVAATLESAHYYHRNRNRIR